MLENCMKVLILIFLPLHIARATPVFVEGETTESTFDPCKDSPNIHNLHPEYMIRYAKSIEIKNYLNLSANPCEDFYNFACGSFDGLRSAGHDKRARLDLKTKMDDEISTMLSTDDPSDMEVDLKVKHFFQSCLNVNQSIESTYNDKLQEIVREFGQMPGLQGSDWQVEDFDWLQTVAEISKKYDIKLIVGYKVNVDFYANEVAPLRIMTPQGGLGQRSMYIDAKLQNSRTSYQNRISTNLKNYLGLEEKLAEKTAKEIFDFETLLTHSTEKSSENLTSIDDMLKKYSPLFDITRFVNTSLGYIPEGAVYDALKYNQEKLSILLKETPKRTVANYIFYNLLKEFIVDPQTVQESCLPKTTRYFSKNIKVMLYRKYITQATEQSVQHMWKVIKSIFRDDLESDRHSWMKEQVRQNALEKLEVTELEIRSLKNTDFSEEFQRLTVDKNDFVENMKSMLHLKGIQHRELSKQHSYDSDFHRTYYPAYYPSENKIIVPASVLKPNFLWSDFYPAALKFSTLGVFIAHQLIHGFDENGRNYDKLGNEFDWWDNDTSSDFANRSKCFAEQYSGYFDDGQGLAELDSQLENIADNGAVRLAYQAYLKWQESCPHKEALEAMPPLNYTSKQLFFIGYGQTRCSTSLDFLDDYATSENTVSDEFRITVPLSNFEDFSQEFTCPRGSAMNPTVKCVMY